MYVYVYGEKERKRGLAEGFYKLRRDAPFLRIRTAKNGRMQHNRKERREKALKTKPPRTKSAPKRRISAKKKGCHARNKNGSTKLEKDAIEKAPADVTRTQTHERGVYLMSSQHDQKKLWCDVGNAQSPMPQKRKKTRLIRQHLERLPVLPFLFVVEMLLSKRTQLKTWRRRACKQAEWRTSEQHQKNKQSRVASLRCV